MRFLGLNISWERKSTTLTFDQLLQRLEAAYQTVSGIVVTPDTAMESPTVQAIVQAVSGTIATLPVQVMRKSMASNGREAKELLPNHPAARLLAMPNDTQDRVTYWLDAASWLVRYGNHYAYKARGVTGPIRRLDFLEPSRVCVHREQDGKITYRVTLHGGGYKEYQPSEIHHARGPARNGYCGDSPIMDVRNAIALEIAAERFGESFFANGATPSLIFKYAQWYVGQQTQEQRTKFIEDFQAAYTAKKRLGAMVLPKGMDMEQVPIDNDKAQFLDTRKLQRNVICGAFNIPPHMAGDLERGTFSNIEHQSLEFIQRVVLRYVRSFEASMERDLLTQEDRNSGVVIRFNLDGALRGDFKSRQEGLNIQRMAGVITANEWREEEGRNPLPTGQGGDEVYQQGPSGQNQPGSKPGAQGGNNATGTA